MKILWLHQYFATPRGWGAVRTHAFARRFVQAGHAVDVVCCAGYDDSLRPTGHEPAVIDGVRVFVSGTAYRPHMGFLRRIVSFLSFMAHALWFVIRRGGGYDVMIASSGPLTLAVPALIGRWFRGLPYVFEVIDVWPDSAIAAGVLKNPMLKWLSFRLEALAYRYAAAIVTCSTGMTERVEKKLGVRSEELGVGDGGKKSALVGEGVSALAGREGGGLRSEDGGRNSKVRKCESSKVVTISNCCDLGAFVPDGARREEIRARYGVREDQTVVLYTGAMGLSNAVGDLVEAVRSTAGDERIVWWFAGGGPRSALLRYCVSSLVGRGEVLKFGSSKVRESETANVEFSRQDAKALEPLNEREARLNPGTLEPAPQARLNPVEPLNQAAGRLNLDPLEPAPQPRFFGSLPKVELIGLYLAADVNVVTFMHAPLFYENSPNKFFDGIAAGLPAVFNRSTWLEPWLKEYDCGVISEGSASGMSMADAIRALADHPERRKRMGRSARRLAEEVFDRDKLAATYLEILGKSCENEPGFPAKTGIK